MMKKLALAAGVAAAVAVGGADAQCTGESVFAAPDFDAAAATVTGQTLTLEVHAANVYNRIKLDLGPGAQCVYEVDSDNAITNGASSQWTVAAHATDSECSSTYTYVGDLADTLSACSFNAVPGTGILSFQKTIEMTTRDNSTAVFGSDTSITTVSAADLQIQYDTNTSTNTVTNEVFGPTISFDAITTQVVNQVGSVNTTLTLATSVQWPYILESPVVDTSTSANWEIDTASLTMVETTCADDTSACVQRWTIPINQIDGQSPCSLDGTFGLDFTINCDDAFDGSCDLPVPNVVQDVTFSIDSDDFCPQVVEVASVSAGVTLFSTPEARTARTPESANFIIGTVVYGRVDFLVEAGVDVATLEPTLIEVQNGCTNCNGGLVTFIDAVAGTNAEALPSFANFGSTSAEGATTTDDVFLFQYDLNTNTALFDNLATSGQTTQVVTAEFALTYTAPGSQKVVHRLLRVPVPAAIGGTTVAVGGSAQAGAASPAAGSSSNAGSSVLGVSQGTVVAAGVALGAVALVAVGAAAGLKKRRSAKAEKKTAARTAATSSSSSIELNPAPVASAAAASVDVPTNNLRTVQGQYTN